MSDLREALSEAMTKSEAPPPEPVAEVAPVEAPAPAEAAEAPKADRARDERGKFAAKEKAVDAPKSVAEVAEASTEPAAPTEEPQAAPDEPKPAAPAIKPPQSWKVAVREKWATLPPEVQQEVARRERETAVAIQESAEARKRDEQWRTVTAPYEPLLRAEGREPAQVVGELLQTAAALRTAPPGHKAQLVAQIIRTYGVPIDALDAVLAGESPPAQAQQPQAPLRDPRVDQLLQTMQQAQRQRAQQTQAKLSQELATFEASHEFLDDVREEMADLLEVASRRGVDMSLEQAYTRAVQLHPELSEVIKQREAAKQAVNAQASTQRARAASSSVQSRPASPTTGGQPEGLRAALEAAVAASGRR